MKKMKKRKIAAMEFTKRTLPISLIDVACLEEEFDKKELKNRAAYFLINGESEFAVNDTGNGRFALLASERDFYAFKSTGATQIKARVYAFTDKHAEAFSIVEKLKNERLGAMEEAYLMKKLIADHSFTQDDVAALIGRSRPAVANILRLLTLDGQVVGLIESGKLSAGHARTLVKVPKEKQFAFAEEALRRDFSVREMERAVKAFLTPPEILQKEKEAKAAAKSEELKELVQRMRMVLGTKVSLIGSDKKGRIYIDYYSPEDLYRFEEFLEIIENNR